MLDGLPDRERLAFQRGSHLASRRQRTGTYTCSVKPTRGGLLLAVATIAAMVVIPATAWATYPGANGRIAYSETRGLVPGGGEYNWEIFTIPPPGGYLNPANGQCDPQYPALLVGRRTKARLHPFGDSRRTSARTKMPGRCARMGPISARSPTGPPQNRRRRFPPAGGRIVMTRGWDGAGDIVIVRTDGRSPFA